MRTETTRLFKDLLSLHGHLADPLPGPVQADPLPTRDAPAPSEEPTMNLFKSLWLLGGLESIDLRVDDEEHAPYPAFGTRQASERRFGKPTVDPRDARRVDAQEQRVAHC